MNKCAYSIYLRPTKPMCILYIQMCSNTNPVTHPTTMCAQKHRAQAHNCITTILTWHMCRWSTLNPNIPNPIYAGRQIFEGRVLNDTHAEDTNWMTYDLGHASIVWNVCKHKSRWNNSSTYSAQSLVRQKTKTPKSCRGYFNVHPLNECWVVYLHCKVTTNIDGWLKFLAICASV